MLKFCVLSLCLVSLLNHALALAIDPNGIDESNELDANSTSLGLPLQPEFVALNVNDKVFFLILIRLNWFSAAEFCSSQNLVLATVDNKQDTRSLIQKLNANGLSNNGDEFWLGGSDLGHIGSYAWLSNGQPFSYTNWLRRQPDNNGGIEHCVEMVKNGRWNDVNCDKANFVICENRCALTSYDVPIYSK